MNEQQLIESGYFDERDKAMEKMNLFLKELQDLLKKRDAVIVHSANSSHDLVVSVQVGPDQYEELIFAEDISETAIKNEWYC